jgi:DNA polymerase III subunit gamma/tau
MEILGHALVDMREAPDAQVVLEIAAVRAVRPDLDSGTEALSERVSVLERSVSGAAAFPRPEALAPRDSSSGSDATGRASPTTMVPETPAAPGPPAEVGRRPSIGAVRRSREATDSTPTAKATAPEPASATPEPAPASEPAPKAPHAGRGKAEVAEPGRELDRDSLTEAWGDGILQSLPARAKARYASGRFVSVDDQGAHFALPNSAHRDQCAEQQSIVEEALTAHFGTKITLVLDIDEAAAPPRSGTSAATPGRSSGAAPPDSDPPADEGEDVDARQLMDEASTDQASDAEARLLQAFPGASEVAG